MLSAVTLSKILCAQYVIGLRQLVCLRINGDIYAALLPVTLQAHYSLGDVVVYEFTCEDVLGLP